MRPAGVEWNALPVRPGELLNLRDIEQALENFKRVPSAQADIQITPAAGPDARPGDSDLVINWKQSMPFRLSLAVDDSGTRAGGKQQSLKYPDAHTRFQTTFRHLIESVKIEPGRP